MPTFRVKVEEHTITTYEVEAESTEDVDGFDFSDETVTNTECLLYSIVEVETL